MTPKGGNTKSWGELISPLSGNPEKNAGNDDDGDGISIVMHSHNPVADPPTTLSRSPSGGVATNHWHDVKMSTMSCTTVITL